MKVFREPRPTLLFKRAPCRSVEVLYGLFERVRRGKGHVVAHLESENEKVVVVIFSDDSKVVWIAQPTELEVVEVD